MGEIPVKPRKFTMRQRLLAITAAALALPILGLSGCALSPRNATLDTESVSYDCAGGVQIDVVYSGKATGMQGAAELVWEGHGFSLKQDVSGSGTRYTDGTLTLFSKGDEAFVEKDGESVLKDCNARPGTP